MENFRFCVLVCAALALTMHAGATGKVRDTKAVDSGIEITIETTVGDQYKLQCRPSLMEGEWVDVGGVFEAISTNSVRVVTTSESQCYLRVVKIESTDITDDLVPPAPPPPPPPPPF